MDSKSSLTKTDTRQIWLCQIACRAMGSLDFLSDTFGASRRFRILAVNDDCCRENLCLMADTSISGARVARELDAVSAIDDDRDFTSYGGRATVGYRVSGPVYATVTGFATYRDFVLPPTPTDPDRDATTYGGRVGISFVDNDRIRGRVGVGIFQFDPQDARLDSRSGLSVDASISLLIDRRAAIIVDAFRGDVATFRAGAQARTDTRAAVTAQVEMRHNFYGRVGLRYRDTNFIGSGISEETYGPNMAVEFLANRNLSLIADATVSERVSDDLFENFERFRAGVTARIRF